MIEPFTAVFCRIICLGWLALLGACTPNASVPEGHYQARVVTLTGRHLRGALQAVDGHGLYLGQPADTDAVLPASRYVATEQIRHVVVLRKQKRGLQIAGAVLGGAGVGYLTLEALRQRPPRSGFTYGITLTFSVVAGAASGYVLGSGANALVDQANRHTFRPPFPGDTSSVLSRQLLPFTEQYRQDLLKRPPAVSPPL